MPLWAGTGHRGTAAPPLLSLEMREQGMEDTVPSSHTLLARHSCHRCAHVCASPCHHGGPAPHNLDGWFISMATFLLKHLKGSLVPCENAGGSVPHSVPCNGLEEKTLAPLLPPSSPSLSPFPVSSASTGAVSCLPHPICLSTACSPFPYLHLCSSLSSCLLPFRAGLWYLLAACLGTSAEGPARKRLIGRGCQKRLLYRRRPCSLVRAI